MSLNGALQVGRSALMASQTALQVTGNNLANAATEGFTRRRVELSPLRDDLVNGNNYVGRGVEVAQVTRVIDTALLARLRDAMSEQSSAETSAGFLSRLESLQNELSDNDLSTLMSDFFNAWSEAANNPSDNAVRSVVVQQGGTLANRIADLRRDYGILRDEIDRQIENSVAGINDITQQVAAINLEISQLEVEDSEAAALRDQRDVLLNELSQFFEIDVYEQPSGAVNVLVNSTPLVLATESLELEMRREVVDNDIRISLRTEETGEVIPQSGTLGALLQDRTEGVDRAITDLDVLASTIMEQVNRLHTQGQPDAMVSTWTGAVTAGSTTDNLNAMSVGLNFDIENGSFMLHLTHEPSGQRVTHRVDVDGDAMSLEDLRDAINTAAGNMNASIDAERRLVLTADAGYAISFSDDTSGALAALGINTFFTGSNAADMAIAERLESAPSQLAVTADHIPGSNGTALAIARLQDEGVDDLDGASLREYWQNAVNTLAVRTNQAQAAAESAAVVRDSLSARFQSISGVSIDEESINLLSFQRQFQAAARFISVIDETLDQLLALA